jgi:hypothetical protein
MERKFTKKRLGDKKPFKKDGDNAFGGKVVGRPSYTARAAHVHPQGDGDQL